jgi:hypothetical protein
VSLGTVEVLTNVIPIGQAKESVVANPPECTCEMPFTITQNMMVCTLEATTARMVLKNPFDLLGISQTLVVHTAPPPPNRVHPDFWMIFVLGALRMGIE